MRLNRREKKEGFQASALINDGFDSARPGLIKIDTVNPRENINRDRRLTKADKFCRIRQIPDCDPFERRAKMGKREVNRPRILWIGLIKRSRSLVARGCA
jgi:hypothetical protein